MRAYLSGSFFHSVIQAGDKGANTPPDDVNPRCRKAKRTSDLTVETRLGFAPAEAGRQNVQTGGEETQGVPEWLQAADSTSGKSS